MNNSSFEYDEDSELYGAEASDEGDAEVDEAWGAEASDEGDTEVDEAWGAEASDEGDSEVDEAWGAEASDEGDGEADEAADEALSASSQLRADTARNRQANWARKIAADQRLEAQRAASVQRSITNRIRSIQPGGRTRVYSVGSLQGAGVVTATLPNGRQSRMRITPTLAPIREVNRLRAAITINDRRQAAATATNSRAITALATTQAATVKKLTDQQVKSDKDLAKRIVEGDNRLDRRIAKELGNGAGSLGKHGKRMMYLLRRQRQRSILNSVLLASAAPFFVAYGDRESPFTKNNAILTGSLLFWLTGDELLDSYGGKSGLATGGSATWSWLAPFANAGTVYYFLSDKQHERFITGVTNVKDAVDGTDAAGTKSVDLSTYIAEGSFDAFKKDEHNVVASLTAGPANQITATIDKSKGILTLTATAADGIAAAAGTVAWIIDTQPLPK